MKTTLKAQIWPINGTPPKNSGLLKWSHFKLQLDSHLGADTLRQCNPELHGAILTSTGLMHPAGKNGPCRQKKPCNQESCTVRNCLYQWSRFQPFIHTVRRSPFSNRKCIQKIFLCKPRNREVFYRN